MPSDVLQNLSLPILGALLAERGAHLQPRKPKAPASPFSALGHCQTGMDLRWAGKMFQPRTWILERAPHRLMKARGRSGWETSGQADDYIVLTNSAESLPDRTHILTF